MVAYAQSLARDKEVTLPEGYERDFKVCRRFLDEHARMTTFKIAQTFRADHAQYSVWRSPVVETQLPSVSRPSETKNLPDLAPTRGPRQLAAEMSAIPGRSLPA